MPRFGKQYRYKGFAASPTTTGPVSPNINLSGIFGTGAVSAPTIPTADVLLTSFVRVNDSASVASPSSYPVGHVVQRGDVPSTSSLILKDTGGTEIPCQFSNRVYDLIDGSLASCAIIPLDSTIGTSASRTYDLYSRPSSSFNDTDRGTTLAQLLALCDPKVTLTSLATDAYEQQFGNGSATAFTLTQFKKTGYSIVVKKNGVTLTPITDYTLSNGSGTTFQGQTGFDGITVTFTVAPANGAVLDFYPTWTHMSGTMTCLASAADVSGRVRTIFAGPNAKRFYTYSYFADGGTDDVHLLVEWYFTCYYNSGGTITAVDVTGVVCLNRFAVNNKVAFTYTAAFLDGASTINTYSSVIHPYRSQWPTVRTANDNMNGRPYRLVGTACTLYSQYDRSYWSAAQQFAPLSTTMSPSQITSGENNGQGSTAYNTFIPCSPQGHRGNIDGTGNYPGRGIVTEFDAVAFMRQGGPDWRTMRVNAIAGLGIPYHGRPPYSSSTPPTCLTLRLDTNTGTGNANQWVAQGMPVAIYASMNVGAPTGGYIVPKGTFGVWNPSTDTSHAVPYSSQGWQVDQEEYFNQANIDLAIAGIINARSNTFNQTTALMYANTSEYPGWAGQSIPTTAWSSIGQITPWSQERCIGWSCATYRTLLQVPTSAMERTFTDDLVEQQSLFMERSIPYFTSDQATQGIYWWDKFLQSPWQASINGTFLAWLAELSGFAGFGDAADLYGIVITNDFTANYWRSASYRGSFLHTMGIAYNSATNPFTGQCILANASSDSGTNVITCADLECEVILHNGDIVYPSDTNTGPNTVSIPSGLTRLTPYYIINVSQANRASATYKLSTTPGGSAVSLGSSVSCAFIYDLQANDTTPVNNAAATAPYFQIAFSHLIMQNRRGYSAATTGMCNNIATWIAAVVNEAEWNTQRN